MLPRKIFENLHTAMAILVLFKQFLRKVCHILRFTKYDANMMMLLGCCNYASRVTFHDLPLSPRMSQCLSFGRSFHFLVLSNYTVYYYCVDATKIKDTN